MEINSALLSLGIFLLSCGITAKLAYREGFLAGRIFELERRIEDMELEEDLKNGLTTYTGTGLTIIERRRD